jgi:hypothetical protein
VPVSANVAHRAARALFGQGLDAGPAQSRIGPGVGVQRNKEISPRVARDLHPATVNDIDVAVARQS